MKLKSGLIYRQIAGEHIVIPVGDNVANFNGVIHLNQTGVFLWKMLQEGAEPEALVDALLAEFEVAREQATKDVEEYLALLREHRMLLDA